MEFNKIYLAKIVCGSDYVALVQKYSSHLHGSATIFSYEKANPIYAKLNNGTWTDTTLITNTDLGGAVFKTASGNLQYGMNGIYVGKFNNGPIEDDGAPFSSCIYLIGTGTNQTSIYAFAITQYFGGHLFFNRLNAANVMELEKWKKLIA